MKIEEAIVYCLATSNRGMRTEQIAQMINSRGLHVRKDAAGRHLSRCMPLSAGFRALL